MIVAWLKSYRSIFLLFVISLAVLLPRSAYIASVHSECIDDEYHLVRGVRFLNGNLGRTSLNDPTLGSSLMALPLWLEGAQPTHDHRFGTILHNQKMPVETLTMQVALWKSILFVPGVLLAFAWIRRLYNERAAWVVAATLLIEPTISAHVAPAGLDVLGFEAILLACFCWWTYFERQSWWRLVLASVVSAAAMLVKHTAIIVPMVAAMYAVAWWARRWRAVRTFPSPLAVEGRGEGANCDEVVRNQLRLATPPPTRGSGFAFRTPARGGELLVGKSSFRRDLVHAVCAVVITMIALTYLSGGFVQIPKQDWIPTDSAIGKLLEHRLPAGYYIKSLLTAMYHGEEGHPSWLLGEWNHEGNWYYYPVVALYKVPIPFLILITIGALSLIKTRPRFGELALLVPMLLLLALITMGGINIGFRHAIPAYALLLMLCARSLLVDVKWLRVTTYSLLAITVLDTARYFPNLISYINFPREKVWMDVNDSNLDWGQGLKQIRAWVETRGKSLAPKPIGVRYFGLEYAPNVEHYLKETRATRVLRNAGPPASGILIISPVYVAGMFEKEGLYDFLRAETPIDIIGDSNLVFDLDEIYTRRPEVRPAPTTKPAE